MQTVTAVNYRLNLEPDLETFTFKGQAVITLNADKPVAALNLNGIVRFKAIGYPSYSNGVFSKS